MNTRGSSRRACACASRMASMYVISVAIFQVRLVQVFGGNRRPVFRKRVGRGFALNLGDGFLDFADGLAAPDGNLRGIGVFILQQKFLGDFQTVASERGIFQLGDNVVRVVMFAVAAEPQ